MYKHLSNGGYAGIIVTEMGAQRFLPGITCASFKFQTVISRSHVSRVYLRLSERRGAKPRLRQRTRSIPQSAGVFVCPRDVMVLRAEPRR